MIWQSSRTVIILAALTILSFIPAPARADDILLVTVPNVTFTGTSVCGASNNSLCSEVFNASFEWDNTTNTVVPGSAQITTTGPLGSFFFFPDPYPPVDHPELIGALWFNSAGDELTADIDR